MNDNVTAFPGASGLPENPLQVAPRQMMYCGHDQVILDEHTRTLQCANTKCGATLDPFNYLRENGHLLARAWSRHREVMRQATEVAERVSDLKKQEQRLRALVKRLQQKTGAVVDVRGRRDL
jgi:hypothetical protein